MDLISLLDDEFGLHIAEQGSFDDDFNLPAVVFGSSSSDGYFNLSTGVLNSTSSDDSFKSTQGTSVGHLDIAQELSTPEIRPLEAVPVSADPSSSDGNCSLHPVEESSSKGILIMEQGSSSSEPPSASSPTTLQPVAPNTPASVSRRYRFGQPPKRSELDPRLSDRVLTLVDGYWMIPKSCSFCLQRRCFCDREMPCTFCVKRGQLCTNMPGLVRAGKRLPRSSRPWKAPPPTIEDEDEDEDEGEGESDGEDEKEVKVEGEKGEEGEIWDEGRDGNQEKEGEEEKEKEREERQRNYIQEPIDDSRIRAPSLGTSRVTTTPPINSITRPGKRARTQGDEVNDANPIEPDKNQNRAFSLEASRDSHSIPARVPITPFTNSQARPRKRARTQKVKAKNKVQENNSLVMPGEECQVLGHALSPVTPAPLEPPPSHIRPPIAFVVRITPSPKALIVHETEAPTLALFLAQVRRRFKLAEEVDITNVTVTLEGSEPLEVGISLDDERDWEVVLSDSRKSGGGESVKVIVETNWVGCSIEKV